MEQQLTHGTCPPEELAKSQPVRWDKLTPAEAWLALKTAPKNIAGPWEPMSPATSDGRWPASKNYCRRTSVEHVLVEEQGERGVCCVDIIGFGNRFADRSAADAWLVEQGWLLVDGT